MRTLIALFALLCASVNAVVVTPEIKAYLYMYEDFALGNIWKNMTLNTLYFGEIVPNLFCSIVGPMAWPTVTSTLAAMGLIPDATAANTALASADSVAVCVSAVVKAIDEQWFTMGNRKNWWGQEAALAY